MRILLAIDGSACSDAAVAEVASRPWPPGSKIKIISAYEVPLTPSPEGWSILNEYYDQMEQAEREHAERAAEAASAKLAPALGQSIEISAQTFSGPPKDVILEQAEQWKADLIVVGSHGYGAWARFLLGSVSQAVVLHAKCSVEVVHCQPPQTDEKQAA
ncbi:MAG TPA: universal stress protein [Pyrinomonadaceae bacterium]|jgi:nucleotide-binding universal stress UspA family protein